MYRTSAFHEANPNTNFMCLSHRNRLRVRVYVLEDDSTAVGPTTLPKKFKPKERVLEQYAADEEAPSSQAKATAPGVSRIMMVKDPFKPTNNFLTDTHGGRFLIFLMCAAGLALAGTLAAVILDRFWWSVRPQLV